MSSSSKGLMHASSTWGEKHMCLYCFTKWAGQSPPPLKTDFYTCAKQSVSTQWPKCIGKLTSKHFECFAYSKTDINWMTNIMQRGKEQVPFFLLLLQCTPLHCCAGKWFENAFHLDLCVQVWHPPKHQIILWHKANVAIKLK